MKTQSISKQQLEAIHRYTTADRSDPFTLARCLAHTRNGIAGFRQDDGKSHRAGDAALYNATEKKEERIDARGESYHVSIYNNMHRP